MKLLAKYKNGNYDVKIYSDGTRISKTDDDVFHAEFPDNIDLKITNKCDIGCPMCHESSDINGVHGSLSSEFLNKLHAGTELAIGGGDAFSHPELYSFLQKMKAQGVICNITLNERHLPRYADEIARLCKSKLLYGIGISVFELNDYTLEFAKKHSNAVLHCVCGVTDADKLLAADADGLKLLILGFKTHGRGKRYFSGSVVRKINYFYKVLPMICDKFDVISYDNLALKQLHIRERVDEITWNETYGGEDGTDNLYVDLVRGVFAMNSRTDEVFPLLPTAEEMLAFIHKRYNIG